MKRFAIFILASGVALAAAAPPTVIQNATVLTVTRGTFHGSVLVRLLESRVGRFLPLAGQAFQG